MHYSTFDNESQSAHANPTGHESRNTEHTVHTVFIGTASLYHTI